MSKIQKSFTYLAFISIIWVLATCSSDSSSGSAKSYDDDDEISSSSSKAATATVTLACTGLPKSVAKGGIIETPDLTCSNGRTATDPHWSLPDGNWEVDPNTNLTSIEIMVSATCGSVELVDVPCGTVKFTTAGGGGSSNSGGTGSSSSGPTVTLTCTGLQANVAKGGTITQPTLACSNGETATDEVWSGLGSGGWTVSANTQTTSYPISVSADCGSVRKTGVSCGTVNVVAASSSSVAPSSSSRGSSSSGTTGSSSSRGSSSSGTAGSSSSVVAGSSSSVVAGSSSSVVAGSSSSVVAGSSSSNNRTITCEFAKNSYLVGEDVTTPTIKCFEGNGNPYTTNVAIGSANYSASSGLALPSATSLWRTTTATAKFGSAGTGTITVSNVGCGSQTGKTVMCTPSLTITAASSSSVAPSSSSATPSSSSATPSSSSVAPSSSSVAPSSSSVAPSSSSVAPSSSSVAPSSSSVAPSSSSVALSSSSSADESSSSSN